MGLHTGFIALSLVLHTWMVLRKSEREPVRIPIRMASTEGRVRLEVSRPKKRPPVEKVKKKFVRKTVEKKVVKEPPPPQEEVPLNQTIQQDFEDSVLTQKAIIYPGIAARRGWEGVVYLELFIDEGGNVEKIQVKRPHTYKVLSDAAILGVKNWRFHARSDARAYSVLKKINFKLRNI